LENVEQDSDRCLAILAADITKYVKPGDKQDNEGFAMQKRSTQLKKGMKHEKRKAMKTHLNGNCFHFHQMSQMHHFLQSSCFLLIVVSVRRKYLIG
jgi:hypothetical protein